MVKNYSRFARLEEGRNIRLAVIFGILSVVLIVLMIFVGVPALTNLTGYVIDSKNKGVVNTINDKTPPGPPFLNQLPEGTNKNKLMIVGSAEPESAITIFINDKEIETEAGTDGAISKEITLINGQNIIYAVAKDKAGNTSADSQKYTVYYSKDKPSLVINKPKDGDNYYGDKQRQLSIEGTTCVTCSVTINDRIALVSSDGSFKLNYQLGDGGNSLNFKSTDKAGNLEETTISVNFTP